MIPVRVKRSLFVPPNRYGWTPWKRTILIRRDYPVSEREMAHELAHVLQWERYGAFFPLVYLWKKKRPGRWPTPSRCARGRERS